MRAQQRFSRIALSAATVALALGVLACGATRARRGEPEQSGFLRDYSQLKKNPAYPAAEVYVREGTDWTRYDSVQIDSVTLWANKEETRLTEQERQMLTDSLYRGLHDEIGKYIEIADQAGLRTLRLRAALTQEKGAMIALRTITTIVPQLRVLTALTGLSADTAVTVGSATVEMEILDSVTGQRLAAAVDARAGNKALFTLRTFQKWGDVEAACKLWSERVAWQLVRHGVRRKAGAGTPEEPSETPTI